MKWFLLSLAILVVCSGQSCLQPFDRLAVNDELRAVCDGYSDSQILGRIEETEVLRAGGATKAELLLYFLGICTSEVCRDCWVAVIDQVYDNAP